MNASVEVISSQIGMTSSEEEKVFLSKETLSNILSVSVFIAYLSLSSIIAWQHPSYNWDVLAYIGAAISIDTHDPVIIHDKTYSIVKQAVPPEIYSSFISSPWLGSKHYTDLVGNYYEMAAKDAECFRQELPFFYVKPLYVFTLYAAMQLGMEPVSFILLFSIACSTGISLLLFYWLTRYISTSWAVLWSIMILSASGIQDIYSITTSDMPVLLMFFLGMYLYFAKNRFHLSIIFLFIATLFRLDAALLGILLISFEAIIGRPSEISLPKRLLYFPLFVLTPIVIQRLVGGYDWSTNFYYTFVQHFPYPKNTDLSITISQYLTVFIEGLRMKGNANVGWTFFIFAILIILLKYFNHSPRRNFDYLYLLGLVYLAMRYIIFPFPAPRFFLVSYLVIAITFVREIDILIGGYPKFNQLIRRFFRKSNPLRVL